MNNERIIRRLYEEGMNHGKREVFAELVDDDYLGSQGERGPEGFRAVVEGLHAGVPDIRFTLEDVLADGDRVAVRWTWTGTHTGVLRGFAPSQKSVQNQGFAIYRLRDGKIVRSWLETDRLGFLQQIGVVPADLGAPPPK